jgi:hypothetical protein
MKIIKCDPVLFLLLILPAAGCSHHSTETEAIPVIYSTDLYHPPMDPDDNFDLACLFSLMELDIQAIIIDNAAKVPVNPGIIPIKQMESITGRNVPYATGLRYGLKSIDDNGSAQKEYTAGVELILKTLGKSAKPVTIITVGSLRDVAAALNSDPELCRKKIGRIFVFAGDASVNNRSVFREYNVDLDTLSFARVMNSGLNIYWVPCFDGGPFINNGRSSWMVAERKQLLSGLSPRLMNYFTYCLLANRDSSYIGALTAPVDSQAVRMITNVQENGSRNLWCSHVFPYIANRSYYIKDGRCTTSLRHKKSGDENVIQPLRFREIYAHSDLSGMVWPDSVKTAANRINVFEITDMKNFRVEMASVVEDLLKEAAE